MAVLINASRGFSFRGEPEPLAVNPVRVSTEVHGGWGGGWVARILALDPSEKGGLKREFVRRESASLSRNGNGRVRFELDRPGIYEVEFVYRSFRTARLYIIVRADGTVGELGWYEKSSGPRPKAIDRAIEQALAELAQAETTPAEAGAAA